MLLRTSTSRAPELAARGTFAWLASNASAEYTEVTDKLTRIGWTSETLSSGISANRSSVHEAQTMKFVHDLENLGER